MALIAPDIDECEMNATLCQENALCTNTAGSYYCECDEGFKMSGRLCMGMHYQTNLSSCSDTFRY